MKRYAAVVLFAIALGGWGCSKHKTVPPTQPRVSATEEFNLRGKCAALGDTMEPSYGRVGVALTSDMVTHYNPETNRCYVQFTATKNFGYSGSPPVADNYFTIAVYDGQTKEMLVYAQQDGDKSHGAIWTRQDFNERYTTLDKAQAETERLMQTGSH